MDLSVFATIESQSSDEDKKTFLACQAAVRELRGEYNYLEIGSYLGGSIQPHLLDKKCRTIISIDKRPKSQPDERGFDWTYLENSTERMIENLKQVAPEYLEKIKTIDGSTEEIDPLSISEPIDLCLIDGEHTDVAMRRDFEFCLAVLNTRGGGNHISRRTDNLQRNIRSP